MSRILLVEDEPAILLGLSAQLRREGYEVHTASTGDEGLALARSLKPDLLVLDLMLPGLSGTEVCRRLRAEPETRDVPIIILSARGEEIDRVVGFEVGADDYVVKPYSTRELVLRVRAVLRRREAPATDAAGAAAAAVRFGNLTVDKDAHKVWVDEVEVLLTALEQRLLQTFLERRGRVQTREMLLSDVWGITADITTRTVDTHVKRLREKLGNAGVYIETVRGAGYRFRAQPEIAG
jgi:two-component system phosphate regulon response regulator PhoB